MGAGGDLRPPDRARRVPPLRRGILEALDRGRLPAELPTTTSAMRVDPGSLSPDPA
jgi:hypothetical protein